MNNLLLFGLTLFCMSPTWFVIKFQLGYVDPLVSVFYRFITASILIFIYLFNQKMGSDMGAAFGAGYFAAICILLGFSLLFLSVLCIAIGLTREEPKVHLYINMVISIITLIITLLQEQ